jgi:hypothetical protein
MVHCPLVWSHEAVRNFPPTFVTHQHFEPTPELLAWLTTNEITVLTTIRHPADTILSYFHFMKWAGASTDPAKKMVADGEQPGEIALEYVRTHFRGTYSISGSSDISVGR